MPFGGFQDLSEVLQTYQVALRQDTFVRPLPLTIDPAIRQRLDFDRLNAPVYVSEQSISDFFIAPILKEIWRSYSDSLMIWSHARFGTTPPLKGFPDYFFTRRSHLGPVPDQPYVLFVEAKRDDFDAAWAQCLAAMLTAQQMNQRPEQAIFGSVTNGEMWYFGKLEGRILLHDPRSFTFTRLDELNYVFQQAKEQALSPSVNEESISRYGSLPGAALG